MFQAFRLKCSALICMNNGNFFVRIFRLRNRSKTYICPWSTIESKAAKQRHSYDGHITPEQAPSSGNLDPGSETARFPVNKC